MSCTMFLCFREKGSWRGRRERLTGPGQGYGEGLGKTEAPYSWGMGRRHYRWAPGTARFPLRDADLRQCFLIKGP